MFGWRWTGKPWPLTDFGWLFRTKMHMVCIDIVRRGLCWKYSARGHKHAMVCIPHQRVHESDNVFLVIWIESYQICTYQNQTCSTYVFSDPATARKCIPTTLAVKVSRFAIVCYSWFASHYLRLANFYLFVTGGGTEERRKKGSRTNSRMHLMDKDEQTKCIPTISVVAKQ